MADIVIIIILVVLLVLGVWSGAKHLKGQGGCCGGGSTVKTKRKKLDHVMGQYTVQIEGMSCEHCKNMVEGKLNDMDGVSATVNLKKKQAIVMMNRPVEQDAIRQVIEKAGYQVTDIHESAR